MAKLTSLIFFPKKTTWGLPILTATPLPKPSISSGIFRASIFFDSGILSHSHESLPKFTLIFNSSFFLACKIPESDKIFNSFFFVSLNNNLAIHLVPFPHASATSPFGLKIFILASI